MIWLVALLAFDPTAAVKALQQKDARRGALRQILNLNAVDLKAARAAPLAQLCAVVVDDATLPFQDRVLAARAAALLGGSGAVAALATAAKGAETPENVALARESAVALRQLRALEALGGAVGSSDPEVRMTVAAAGAAPGRLCALLQGDAWPRVRAAAARGLASHQDLAGCLAKGLEDADERVQIAAATAAGASGQAALVAALRRLAGRPGAAVPARAEALVSLARLGDVAPARVVLTTHLSKGGIVPLARAAVRGLDLGGHAQDLQRLRAALKSKAWPVRRSAAVALAARADSEGLRLIAELAATAEPREAQALRALSREKARPETDPADSDPE